jgi:hypothetical protein
MENSEEVTGTPDVSYDLMSVAYHALEAADTCSVYLDDVESEEDGDEEVAALFRDTIEMNRSLAARAKTLLAQRLAAETSTPMRQSGEEAPAP